MTSEGHWTAVALSAAIEAGSTCGVIVRGKEFVVWRDAAGGIHVWEDRCPHRGMRLSFGAVRGDRLACLYHGWQYDGVGQCQAIPAHPELDPPKTVKVTTYRSIEAFGIVWMSANADTPAPVALQASKTTPLRSLTLQCPLEIAIDELAACQLPAFSGSADTTKLDIIAAEPALWMLANGSDRLLVAGQVIDEARCCLHMAILGSAEIYARQGQIHFARWAEGFRASVEAGYGAFTQDVA